MRTILIRAGLACATSALSGGAAYATVTPIQGTPIVLEHDPQGIIAHGTTDAHGSATFAGLRPGRYAVFVTGTDLIAALDRTAARGGHRIALTADIPIADSALDRTAARRAPGPCLTIAIVGGTVAAPAIAPVCRDSAGRGVRIGFTVPPRAGAGGAHPAEVRVTISGQDAPDGRTSR
jgi:hypothetical protein